ncbi:MAG: hypothetical protein M3376_05815 [Actinomycetota bacterium]|nr:hypothetical protein [Actinomycetota bacterium]
MTTPLLFGKRRPVPASTAAQYVGTGTEFEPVKDPLLFGKRRSVAADAAAQYVGTDTEFEPLKDPKAR